MLKDVNTSKKQEHMLITLTVIEDWNVSCVCVLEIHF